MKNIVLASVAVLVALSAFGQARALPDLKGRTIRAVTTNASPPLSFVDPKTGTAVGWEYDAVNEIGKKLDAKIAWSTSSWDAIIQAVRDGQFDVGMDGFSITDGRKKQVAFSDPYMASQQLMLVRADENRFTTAAEFGKDQALLIGSQAGTTSFSVGVYNVLDGDEKNARIRLFETRGAAVRALLAGNVDTVLVDAASSRGWIASNPGQAEGPRRAAGHGHLRLHLQAGLRPRRSVQCRHHRPESRRHAGQAHEQVVLRLFHAVAGAQAFRVPGASFRSRRSGCR